MTTSRPNLNQVELNKKVSFTQISIALIVVIAGLILQGNQSFLFNGHRQDGIFIILSLASVPLGLSFILYQLWKIWSSPEYLHFDVKKKILKMPNSQNINFNELSSCLLTLRNNRYEVDIIFKNGKMMTTGSMYISCLNDLQLKNAFKEINELISIAEKKSTMEEKKLEEN